MMVEKDLNVMVGWVVGAAVVFNVCHDVVECGFICGGELLLA